MDLNMMKRVKPRKGKLPRIKRSWTFWRNTRRERHIESCATLPLWLQLTGVLKLHRKKDGMFGVTTGVDKHSLDTKNLCEPCKQVKPKAFSNEQAISLNQSVLSAILKQLDKDSLSLPLPLLFTTQIPLNHNIVCKVKIEFIAQEPAKKEDVKSSI